METLLVFITTPLFIAFILIESIISVYHNRRLYIVKDSAVSVLLGIGGLLSDIGMKFIGFGVLDFFSRHAFFHIESTAWSWVAVFFAQDFCFYWLHRTEHFCRFFWAVHVNHHSSEKFNFTVALRSSVLQPLYRFVFYIPAALCGFTGAQIMFMYALNQSYSFFVHTTTIGRLGFLEWFLVTPSHHRVHHGSNVQYLDRNMGQVLIIWDRLFGTFAEETEPVKYGITTNVQSYNPIKVIFHEWFNIARDVRKAPTLRDKFNYVFAPPGWSHDGSTLTSSQLRAEMRAGTQAVMEEDNLEVEGDAQLMANS
jgi:sterol desaturase/sphingolipid hydroxylase (fatty acid hydroxylase superfamily)